MFDAFAPADLFDRGEQVGGPMYAIKNGLSRRWRWLGAAFAIFGGLAGFGIGNMVQSNSIAAAMQGSFNITPLVTGVVLTVVTGAVILGGISMLVAAVSVLVVKDIGAAKIEGIGGGSH